MATRVGIGDLADRSVPFATCVTTLRRALDAGLNVIDTAPNYENGYSEQIVGAAVRRQRDRVFVIDKIDHLDRPVAEQVEGSLQRLVLEHVDLFVFHALKSVEQWTQLTTRGGGFDQLADLVRSGRVRFRGISCHHPEVLELAIKSGLCDVVMFPVGPFVDGRYLELLSLARENRVGTISFKTFGAGMLLGDTAGYGQPLPNAPVSGPPKLPHLSVRECVRYTLTCDPDVALIGMSSAAEQDAALAAAAEFEPMDEVERHDVLERARVAIEGKGNCWWNP